MALELLGFGPRATSFTARLVGSVGRHDYLVSTAQRMRRHVLWKAR